jgi:hypothetical protein
MTISTSIALGISTVALSLNLFRYDGAKNPVKKGDGTKRYGTPK